MAMTCGSALMLIECMHATAVCWLWMNRKYVGIGACLILNVSLLGIQYTMHDAITIAHSATIQLQWQWHAYGSAMMLVQYME